MRKNQENYTNTEFNQPNSGPIWDQIEADLEFAMSNLPPIQEAAEAAVELGDLDIALDYINRVRNRAKNMTYVQNEAGTSSAANYQIEPYPNFSDQNNARNAVRMERRLELAMEGHRLFDIRRWGNGIEIMNDYFLNEARTIPNFGAKVGTYESKHDLLPIPLTAIDLSGGVLQQNLGF